jgi:thiol:disulfide interchange protein DsbA
MNPAGFYPVLIGNNFQEKNMRRILMLIVFSAWTISACNAQESGFQEGVNYSRVDFETPVDGQVEVIEFFSYTCPHCAAFAPYIHRWQKKQPSNVKVTYVPVMFHESLLNYAKAHYAAQLLGIAEKVQPLMFEVIHVKNQPLETPEKIADLAASVGVDKTRFLETMNSFAVDNSLRQGMQRTQRYRVSSVPMVAVNGKYITNVGMAGGNEQTLEVMDHLVRLETKAKAKPKPANATAPAVPAAGAAAK